MRMRSRVTLVGVSLSVCMCVCVYVPVLTTRVLILAVQAQRGTKGIGTILRKFLTLVDFAKSALFKSHGVIYLFDI